MNPVCAFMYRFCEIHKCEMLHFAREPKGQEKWFCAECHPPERRKP